MLFIFFTEHLYYLKWFMTQFHTTNMQKEYN